MDQLTAVYNSQRLRLVNTAKAAAGQIWAKEWRNSDQMMAQMLPLVARGQAHTVHLVDAYMTAKVRQHAGHAKVVGLDPKDFTVEKMRGVTAEKVYSRPYGALYGDLGHGKPFEAAMAAAAAYVGKTVATDLQMAQTFSAQAYMGDSEHIAGYQRTADGAACDYCTEAADGFYTVEDLMPIHEHCTCGVEPIFSTGGLSQNPSGAPGELGARLDTP